MRTRNFLAETDVGMQIAGLSPRRTRRRRVAEDRTGDRTVCKVALFSPDGKLCIGQRNDSGKWTFPGGHADEGETPVEAACREVEEETGIRLDPNDLEHLDSREIKRDDGTITVHVFRCDVADVQTDTTSDPDGEVTDWVWVDVSDGMPQAYLDAPHVDPRSDVMMSALGLAPELNAESFTRKFAEIALSEADEGDRLAKERDRISDMLAGSYKNASPEIRAKYQKQLDAIRAKMKKLRGESIEDTEVDPDGEEIEDENPPDLPGCDEKKIGRISKRLYKSIDALAGEVKLLGIDELSDTVAGMEDAYWEIQKAVARASSASRTEDAEQFVDNFLDEMRRGGGK